MGIILNGILNSHWHALLHRGSCARRWLGRERALRGWTSWGLAWRRRGWPVSRLLPKRRRSSLASLRKSGFGDAWLHRSDSDQQPRAQQKDHITAMEEPLQRILPGSLVARLPKSVQVLIVLK